MDPPKPSSPIRLLSRRPSSPQNLTPNGVIVVGFVGPEDESSTIINRILEKRIFGSNAEKGLFSFDNSDENGKRIRYHHEEAMGVVYLLLSSDGFLDSSDSEFLRFLLLIFSICHVVVFLHQGVHFDSKFLKKLRILQSAKHALAPFVRAQLVSPNVQSKTSASPGRTVNKRGSSTSHNPAVRLLWGSGLQPPVLPGLCIPVLLFVFLHNLSDFSAESEVSSKLEVTQKKKKLLGSLESQIRLLIKKCRILSSQSASSLPLFSFDPSRVAVLVDRSTTRRGESLDHVADVIERTWNSKYSVDLLKSSDLESTSDDVQSIKDFISKQIDALRGRGHLPSSGGTSSSTGVGMVAAAAAAAAASTGSGKRITAPELPDLTKWLSQSSCLFQCLLSANSMKMRSDDGKLNKQRSSVPVNSIDGAITLLDDCNGLNMRFSVLWCQRALPAAKEIYLKDLPACYPTMMHRAQLEKALDSFCRCVRGPAVGLYAKRLEDDCNSIWKAGRQLCDALSLTGKPCVYPMHHGISDGVGKSRMHSSGFVYLHACACGRSRCLREDPFDFGTANAGFNFFPSCDGQLPQLHLSEGNGIGCLPASSWIVVRLGAASYYDPSKGLMQMGFCPNDNFLLKWTISGNGDSQISLDMTNSSITTEQITETEPNSQSELKKTSGNISSDLSSQFVGKGTPILLKKPFSEVVAGSAAPQIQQKKLDNDFMRDESHSVPLTETSQISAHRDSQVKLGTSVDSFVQTGSNAVPVNDDRAKNTELKDSSSQINIYIGLEHECPSGHRFILSAKHLKGAGYSILQRESSSGLHCVENKSKDHGGSDAFPLLDKSLPMYIECPLCTDIRDKKLQTLKFASGISQLQRIFLVTPPLPFILSTRPVIQFQDACLPASVSDREEQSQFSPACQIILPSESFISLRLPFIYGVRADDGSLKALLPLEKQPELTASLAHGIVLQYSSKG